MVQALAAQPDVAACSQLSTFVRDARRVYSFLGRFNDHQILGNPRRKYALSMFLRGMANSVAELTAARAQLPEAVSKFLESK